MQWIMFQFFMMIAKMFIEHSLVCEVHSIKGVKFYMKEITKGFKTTEFWVSFVTFLFLVAQGVLYYFENVEPNTVITVSVVVAAISYGTQRAYVKGKGSLVGMASAIAPGVMQAVSQLSSHELPKTNEAVVQANLSSPTPEETEDFSNAVVIEFKDINGNIIVPTNSPDPLT